VVPQLVRKFYLLIDEEVPPEWREAQLPSSEPHETLYGELDRAEKLAGEALASQQNAELLQEMIRVVSGADIADRAEFGNWVDTLNQGASLEGVYNGLIHSTKYVDLERNAQAASVGALDVFSTEMAWLSRELPGPTEFDFESLPVRAIPAPLPTFEPHPEATSSQFEWKEPSAEELRLEKERFTKLFIGKNFFLLKRVLGDEALRAIALHEENAPIFATWFGHWVGHTLSWGVEFGLKGRMQANPSFHYQWALGVPFDRIKWEVLNRLHRLMNAKRGQS
jgi:hypothetical protein